SRAAPRAGAPAVVLSPAPTVVAGAELAPRATADRRALPVRPPLTPAEGSTHLWLILALVTAALMGALGMLGARLNRRLRR
ncbi:MAG TPA: hypothetical protein VMZ51_04790, partial [Acidimicrobiales bacterium]|nr:hypothetical protein [Acidimicrobiales bacterium]